MSETISLPERPRVKLIYEVLYLDGRVRLGFGPGFTSEIEDPEGTWAQMIKLLDGSRTVEELTALLAGTLTPGQVQEGLEAMHMGQLIEDAADPVPSGLADGDPDRYRANLNFFRTVVPPGVSPYSLQASLKSLRVTVFGVGGIGSNVCMSLAELGVGSVTLVDFDKVELSNLNRQVLYSTALVGSSKANAARERIKEFNPGIEVTAHDRRITSLADVEDLLDVSRPDFVFCLADKPNGYIDFWVNEACVRRGIPFAAASVGPRTGTMYSVIPGEGPCYQCRSDAETQGSPELLDALNYVREFDVNASNGALGPACMLLAYFLSYELLRWRLEGLGPLLSSKSLLEVDLLSAEQQWHPFERLATCAVCGSENGG